MTLSIIIYLAFLFRLTCRYQKFYQQWCCNNYSDDEDINIAWLRQYGIGVMLIGVAYFWLLFDGNTYCFIVHNLTVQCFFCYTLYKGLFHDNPYAENFSVIHWMKRMHCRKLNLEKNNCLPVRSVFRRAKAHF